jgi:hypothetical protein
MSSDARPPAFVEKHEEEPDDWQRTFIYNQERSLNSQEELVTTLRALLEQQKSMGVFVDKFTEHLDNLGVQMQASIRSMGDFNKAIIRIPIVIVVAGLASWMFYLEKISENAWLVILAVSTFSYLGENLSAVAKLFGLSRTGGSSGNEEKKT